MAKTKRRRRRNPATVNPPRRASRRRRNPAGSLNTRSLVNLAIDGALHGGLVVGGMAAVRIVRKQFGYAPGSVVGSGVEAVAALALGYLGARFIGPDKARSVMHGGFAASISSVLKDATKGVEQLRFVNEALGESGAFDTQVVFLPADSPALAGYEDEGQGGFSLAALAGYDDGSGRSPQLAGMYQ